MDLTKVLLIFFLCTISQVHSQYETLYPLGSQYPRTSFTSEYMNPQLNSRAEGYEMGYPLGHRYPRKPSDESESKGIPINNPPAVVQLPMAQYNSQQFSIPQYNQQQPRGFLGPLFTEAGNQYLAYADRYDRVRLATGLGDPRYSARLRNIGVAKRNWGELFNLMRW